MNFSLIVLCCVIFNIVNANDFLVDQSTSSCSTEVDQLDVNQSKGKLIRIIREKELFEDSFYISNNSDVRSAQTDPLEHYILYGWKEGRASNRFIDKCYTLTDLMHAFYTGKLLDEVKPYEITPFSLPLDKQIVVQDNQEVLYQFPRANYINGSFKFWKTVSLDIDRECSQKSLSIFEVTDCLLTSSRMIIEKNHIRIPNGRLHNPQKSWILFQNQMKSCAQRMNILVVGDLHWSNNLYHDLTAGIPIIYTIAKFLRESEHSTSDEIYILYNGLFKEEFSLILENKLGIPQNHILDFSQSYQTNRLLFQHTFSGPSKLLQTLPITLDIFSDYLPNHLVSKDYIYISRNDADKRKIINDSEVSSVLAGYGFKTVLLSGKTLFEQIQIFSTAKIIIGSHGAGFTNILFANSGAIVCEIFHPFNNNPPCFNDICAFKKHTHYIMLGKIMPEDIDSDFSNRDTEVDIEVLKSWVESII